MKRKVLVLLAMVILVFLMGCATDTPWRKATVSTFELVGIGVEAGRDTAQAMKVQNLITDDHLLKIKDAYNKASKAYAAAGNALKLAGRAESAASRDALLAEYDKLLTDFKALAYQVYDLIKGFKKVSYNEMLNLIATGSEVM